MGARLRCSERKSLWRMAALRCMAGGNMGVSVGGLFHGGVPEHLGHQLQLLPAES